VVVEAARKSGTFITAGYALEENRSVYAVPGDITRVNSLGTNHLIQEGAHLVTCGRDVLLDLKKELRHLIDGLPDIADPDEDAPPPLPKDLSDTERLILEALETDTLSIDQLSDNLADKAVLTPTDLMAALLNLEIRGLVRQEPGKRFRRITNHT
jgi:DNA processing protein